MQWRESRDGTLPLLHLSGEIDLASSPDLREVLHDLLKKRPPVLILDFTGVSYIDSSGLATLVEYVKEAHAFEGKLVVAGLIDSLRANFELTQMEKVMTIHSTLAEACAAFH